jgi:hypothetical protein
LKIAKNNMGKSMNIIIMYFRAEGSLNQHLKLKHPELVRERVSGEDEDNEPHDMLEGDDSL